MSRIKKGYLVHLKTDPKQVLKVYKIQPGVKYPYYCAPPNAKDGDPLTPYRADELEIEEE